MNSAEVDNVIGRVSDEVEARVIPNAEGFGVGVRSDEGRCDDGDVRFKD